MNMTVQLVMCRLLSTLLMDWRTSFMHKSFEVLKTTSYKWNKRVQSYNSFAF